MGITPAALRMIIRYMPVESVLCLSCPDFVMPLSVFRRLTGSEVSTSDKYSAWHSVDYPLPDTLEAFKAMGVERMRFVDVVASRGVEDIADLNYPQDFGKHDMVLDCGTTEHCANIWQATVNAANAVKVGGVLLHYVPLTNMNHGFFCPQPTFYADTYEGWDVKAYATNGVDIEPLPTFTGFNVAHGTDMLVVAQRKTDRPITYPVQMKYKINPNLT